METSTTPSKKWCPLCLASGCLGSEQAARRESPRPQCLSSRFPAQVLYADRDYARGDQVLITYGQKSNAELLLLYGFVVDRNLYDEVDLTVGLDPEDPRYDEKVAFLARQASYDRYDRHCRYDQRR